MDKSLREMQLEADSIYTIEYTRKQLNSLVSYCIAMQEDYEDDLKYIENTRHIPCDTLREHSVFFVDDSSIIPSLFPDEFKDEALGFFYRGYPVYNGRVVYPVKDVNGDVMGLCGWDGFELPKYLDSKNQGYKAKLTTMFGMEKMEEYYKSDKPVFFLEGIVCTLYLRSVGFQALSTLGSHLTPYVIEVIRRFGDRAVVIPDNDSAGEGFVKQVKKRISNAIVAQSRVAKDIDDTRKLEDGKYEKQLIHELDTLSNPYINREVIRIR